MNPLIATLKGELSAEERDALELLEEMGQSDLLASIHSAEGVKKLLWQVSALNAGYPNGLKSYVENARSLVDKSLREINPYDGYTPSVPVGKNLKFGSAEFAECEAVGLRELQHSGFVLVAGGLGERLGYDSIKISLDSEIATCTPFIGLYIHTILEYQCITKADPLPLFIMTSDQTDTKTREYLFENNYFGMKKEQITICKQNGVPAFVNQKGQFKVSNGEIVCKPHGHGDVHILMHLSGTAAKWESMGIKWIVFFQDTNGLAFHGIPALVGTSALLKLAVNSLAVDRKAKEKVGGLCTLTHTNGSSFTVNVEYNQLDAMIKTVDPRGDENDPITGYSPYPGNINVFCIACPSYVATLKASGGGVPEFVNPKWLPDKSGFKDPARLECMMQDYPKLLAPSDRVGFTAMERWLVFSAVKNSASNAMIQFAQCGLEESLASGERDVYKMFSRHLEAAGCTVGKNCSIVLTPRFAVTASQITARLGTGVVLHDNATLVLDGDFCVEHLDVDGTLILQGAPGAHVTIRSLTVKNAGWRPKAVAEDDVSFDTQTRSRGYTLEKLGQEVRVFSRGCHVVSEL